MLSTPILSTFPLPFYLPFSFPIQEVVGGEAEVNVSTGRWMGAPPTGANCSTDTDSPITFPHGIFDVACSPEHLLGILTPCTHQITCSLANDFETAHGLQIIIVHTSRKENPNMSGCCERYNFASC